MNKTKEQLRAIGSYFGLKESFLNAFVENNANNTEKDILLCYIREFIQQNASTKYKVLTASELKRRFIEFCRSLTPKLISTDDEAIDALIAFAQKKQSEQNRFLSYRILTTTVPLMAKLGHIRAALQSIISSAYTEAIDKKEVIGNKVEAVSRVSYTGVAKQEIVGSKFRSDWDLKNIATNYLNTNYEINEPDLKAKVFSLLINILLADNDTRTMSESKLIEVLDQIDLQKCLNHDFDNYDEDIQFVFDIKKIKKSEVQAVPEIQEVVKKPIPFNELISLQNNQFLINNKIPSQFYDTFNKTVIDIFERYLSIQLDDPKNPNSYQILLEDAQIEAYDVMFRNNLRMRSGMSH